MSYLPDLRSSLVSAAERVVDPSPAADRAAARRHRRGAIDLRVLPVALGVAVAVAIAVLALTQIRHRTAPHPPASTTATQVRGRQALVDILGVLRRPQTAADLDSKALRMLVAPIGGGTPFGGTPDRALIRRAGTTPWGSPIFLVPEATKLTRAPLPGGTAYAPLRGSSNAKTERLMLADGTGSTCCAPASVIQASGLELLEVAARPSAHTRIVQVVPDGVTKVTFVLPRQPDPSNAKAPIYPHPLPVSAPVHDNVVAVQMPRACCEGDIPQIWRGADGHVVKRIGHLVAATRVVPPPRPGPETSRSRLAERDPSTPNRVWVTPLTGGPHTNFLMRFRNLLNEATYAYHLAGPRCPSITVPAGGGGGPSGLRGRLFTGGVGGGTWCPGTYHLSISVMANPGAHSHKPFGTATFTVHR